MKEEDIPRDQTNHEGIAELSILKPGRQLYVVDHSTPSRHPQLADKDLLVATLSFEIGIEDKDSVR